MKKIKILLVCLILSVLCGCDYFTVETKNIIDYRHNEAHTETYSSGSGTALKIESEYYPESWELRYEVTYADGHIERYWEDCTRFEYKKAVQELGE